VRQPAAAACVRALTRSVLQTQDMQIRVLVPMKDGGFQVQERTIIEDKRMRRWTDLFANVRQVRVDRPFDEVSTERRFENAEYCILAPTSRRLSQYALEAMHYERVDRMLLRVMPLALVGVSMWCGSCLVFGCASWRCFFALGYHTFAGSSSAFDCWWHEKPCQVQNPPPQILRSLVPDYAMKGLLLFGNGTLFVVIACVYCYFMRVLATNAFCWLQSLRLSRYAQEEEEVDSRHHRQSLDAPRERCPPSSPRCHALEHGP
jgi:hypothetical protein